MVDSARTRRLIRRIALAGFLVVLGASPAVPAGSGRPATFSDAGLEPQLARILDEIEKNRLGEALQQTENLLRQYPNFRLGHLIKGDQIGRASCRERV